LTRSKKDAVPSLTQVLFDPVQVIFFLPEGQKIEKFGIFRGNFPNPNQRWLTQPEQQKIDPDPSLRLHNNTHLT